MNQTLAECSQSEVRVEQVKVLPIVSFVVDRDQREDYNHLLSSRSCDRPGNHFDRM